MPKTVVPIQVRWGDLDAYGHVNNVAILRLLEEARARAFWDNGPLPPLDPSEARWSLIASIEVKYLAPLDYATTPVSIEMSTRSVGGASFVIDYAVVPVHGRTCVTASSTIVLVDAATGRPARLDEATKEALRRFAS